MFMQRHLDMNSLGDVNPILMITTLYKDNFFLFENDTWDIQANNLDQIDGALLFTSIQTAALRLSKYLSLKFALFWRVHACMRVYDACLFAQWSQILQRIIRLVPLVAKTKNRFKACSNVWYALHCFPSCFCQPCSTWMM